MTHLDDSTLNEYLDSALPASRRAEAETHLAACPDCAARLAALRAVFASLDSLPDLAPETDLSARVVAAIRARPAPALPRSPALRLALAVQAALALALLAFALPFALQSLTTPALTEVTAQFTLAFTDFITFELPDLQPAFDPALVSAPALSLPALSTLSLALIVSAAGLLWLVGNGLLLRNTLNARKAR